jgi:hypothetical protein
MVPPNTGVGLNFRRYWDMILIVSTERLGLPGDDASWPERKGFVQKSLTYPIDPERPTATCHLQEAAEANALCGYQWEMLVPVPGAGSLADVPDALRWPKCAATVG